MKVGTVKTLGKISGGCFAWLVIVGPLLAAWLTHVVYTIRAEEWVFLLAGAIFAPIGIIHGIGLWLGFF